MWSCVLYLIFVMDKCGYRHKTIAHICTMCSVYLYSQIRNRLLFTEYWSHWKSFVILILISTIVRIIPSNKNFPCYHFTKRKKRQCEQLKKKFWGFKKQLILRNVKYSSNMTIDSSNNHIYWSSNSGKSFNALMKSLHFLRQKVLLQIKELTYKGEMDFPKKNKFWKFFVIFYGTYFEIFRICIEYIILLLQFYY